MADEIIFTHNIAFDDFVGFVSKFGKVGNLYGLLVFEFPVSFDESFSNRCVIDENIINSMLSDIFLDNSDEILDLEVIRLSMFCHDIAYIEYLRIWFVDGLSNTIDEEIGDDARIEIARTDDDIIRIEQSLSGSWIEFAATDKERIADREIRIVLRDIDIGLSDDLRAIFEGDAELDVIECHRDDFPSDIEHLWELFDRFFEVSGDIGEGCEEEIPDRVTRHTISRLESVFEEFSDDTRILREGCDRPTDIPRREYPELIADLTRTPSRIGDRNDCREIVIFILFETIENIKSSCPSSNRCNVDFHYYFLTLWVVCIRLYRFYILINLFMDGNTLIVLLVVLAVVIPMFVKKVSQGELGLREFLGRYTDTVSPGIVFLIPGIQTLRKIDVREQVITVPEQQIITRDNVGVAVDGIVYIQITDPVKAQYEISNVFMAVVNLAQTSLRSVLGTMALDETLSNRETINAKLLESLDRETGKWGVKVMRVEIKKLEPPKDIQDSMSKQMKAERDKRALILEAEGYKQSQITKNEWDKQSKILQAEGERQSQILQAEWKAQATIAIAEADAKALELQSNAAQEFFKGQAVTKEQLKVIENALWGGNTKYVLDSDILTSISKSFGIK